MGLGCVMVFWGTILLILGVPMVAALRRAAQRGSDPLRRQRLDTWLTRALPLIGLYAFLAVAGYVGFCVARGVDIGLGDWWGVPLRNGYSLTYIDTLERATVHERGASAGRRVVSDILEVAEVGDYLVGVTDERVAFVLDTRSGAVVERGALATALAEVGLPPAIELQPVDSFYMRQRWGWYDLLALVVIVVPSLAAAAATFARAWRGTGARVA